MVNPGSRNGGQPTSDLRLIADEVACRQFVELVTDYLEGTLPPRTLSQVEEHLVMCDWCVTYVEQMKLTMGFLGRLGNRAAPGPPASLLAAVRARKAARE